MRDHVIPAHVCLDCGTVLDGAMGLTTEARPDPGDITICFTCGHIMAFAADLTFRSLTDEEMLGIAGDPTIVRAQTLRALFMLKRSPDEPPAADVAEPNRVERRARASGRRRP